MPKKEKKRLQVVISEGQDALLTKAAYELSSAERLVSKSEVVRLAIKRIAHELEDGDLSASELMKELGVSELEEEGE
jgi:ribosomal protein L20